jgi:hypothetical protein
MFTFLYCSLLTKTASFLVCAALRTYPTASRYNTRERQNPTGVLRDCVIDPESRLRLLLHAKSAYRSLALVRSSGHSLRGLRKGASRPHRADTRL